MDFNGGASIELRGKEAETHPGMFYVRTTDGTNTKNLSLKPDGTFTWDNKTVLTTANGLPLTGGTMSGEIVASGGYLARQYTDAGAVVIRGGTDGTSSSLVLNGKNHATNKGWFTLQANNGSTVQYFIGKPDGTLLWGGHSARHYLNHATATNIAVDGSSVTVPYDGLLYVWLQRSGDSQGTVSVTINGYKMPTLTSNDYSWCICPYPVEKGQVVSIVQNGITSCNAKIYAFK